MSSGARYVYGKNSVKAMIESHPNRVFKLFIAEFLKPDKRIQAIREVASEHGIPVLMVPRQKLDHMLSHQIGHQQATAAANQPKVVSVNAIGERTIVQAPAEDDSITHQGIVASVAPKALLDLQALLKICEAKKAEGKHPRLLILDGVTDSRNFGAILRVADAAGIDGVVIPKHHSAGFGPGVSKTASGAEEIVNIAVVSNVNQAMGKIKDAGFWIAGAANEPSAVDYFKQDYQMPLALVMGNEGEGLASLVQKNCDFLVKIPMHGTVDSLNVASATAVLLFEIVKNK
jgi:23S rRNA (guanosine2251-2'-O)-methyltransferase